MSLVGKYRTGNEPVCTIVPVTFLGGFLLILWSPLTSCGLSRKGVSSGTSPRKKIIMEPPRRLLFAMCTHGWIEVEVWADPRRKGARHVISGCNRTGDDRRPASFRAGGVGREGCQWADSISMKITTNSDPITPNLL